MKKELRSESMENLIASRPIALILFFLMGATIAVIFFAGQRILVGHELVLINYLVPILAGGVPAAIIAHLNMKIYEVQSKQQLELEESHEQLESYNEIFVALNEDLENSYREMNKLAADLENIINLIVDLSGSRIEGEEEFLSKLLYTANKVISEADYGSVFMYRDNKVNFIDAIGHDISILKDLKIDLDLLGIKIEDTIGINMMRNIVENLSRGMDRDTAQKFKEAIKEAKKSMIVNLDINGEIVAGISLELAQDSEQNFDKSSKRIMDAFKNLASSFFTLKRYSRLQEEFQREIIISVTKILELHDQYTKGHSQNVASLSEKIAKKMKLNTETISKAYWAGLVHDIGKILVPKQTLNKEGPLSDEEYQTIQKHSYWGYKTLYNSKRLKDIADYILHHHERWAGGGYPEALKGDEIPIVSQIITVADAWDAMRTDRPYRKRLSREIAIEEIKQNKGEQFSPQVVNAFLEVIGDNQGEAI